MHDTSYQLSNASNTVWIVNAQSIKRNRMTERVSDVYLHTFFMIMMPSFITLHFRGHRIWQLAFMDNDTHIDFWCDQ